MTIDIAKEIEGKIQRLDAGMDAIKGLAERKAKAVADYEKAIGVTLIKLANGIEFEIDGAKVKSPPVSTSEKIAKAICYQEHLNAELAEGQYKVALLKMDAIETQLNGWQSIFRHLDKGQL